MCNVLQWQKLNACSDLNRHLISVTAKHYTHQNPQDHDASAKHLADFGVCADNCPVCGNRSRRNPRSRCAWLTGHERRLWYARTSIGSMQLQKLQFQSVIYGHPEHTNWYQSFPCTFDYFLARYGMLAGPRLNIKTVLFTYGDFHVKDKTAVRTSYL